MTTTPSTTSLTTARLVFCERSPPSCSLIESTFHSCRTHVVLHSLDPSRHTTCHKRRTPNLNSNLSNCQNRHYHHHPHCTHRRTKIFERAPPSWLSIESILHSCRTPVFPRHHSRRTPNLIPKRPNRQSCPHHHLPRRNTHRRNHVVQVAMVMAAMTCCQSCPHHHLPRRNTHRRNHVVQVAMVVAAIPCCWTHC